MGCDEVYAICNLWKELLLILKGNPLNTEKVKCIWCKSIRCLSTLKCPIFHIARKLNINPNMKNIISARHYSRFEFKSAQRGLNHGSCHL